MKRAIFNWSGGKDSALALYHLQKNNEFEIYKLLTSISGLHQRVTMHGVRRSLLEEQAKALELELLTLELPEQPSMEAYNTLMEKTNVSFKNQGIEYSVFGDIFLEDLKTYRETQLLKAGLKALFPLWKRNTLEVVHEFIDLGFKAVVVCVNDNLLGKEFVGQTLDSNFLKELPKNVDPCGENGEFHTFVYDGPNFKNPIPFTLGPSTLKTYEAPKNKEDNCFKSETNPKPVGFYFCDLIPN